MPRVEACGLSRNYGEVLALSGVELTLAGGEFMALLGASGSGKTTLLRLLAGLDRPSAGRVTVDGTIGMVFQDLGLWPHLRAQRQVELVLRASGSARSALELLESLKIADRASAYPSELSGGEAQRLALARTLAADPSVLLLDEPLSSLDRPLRDALFEEILSLHRQLGAATLYVTHDATEALAADRLAIIERGRLVQCGPPEQVYRQPATAEAARLTGPVGFLPDGEQALALRPEDISIDESGSREGVVRSARLEGGSWRLGLQVGDRLLWARSPERPEEGATVRFTATEAAWRVPWP